MLVLGCRVQQTAIAVTILASVGWGSVAVAQDDPARFAGEATVNVVEVPVQVYDSATGEPVTGLTPADFMVRENGVVQEISNFTEITRGAQPEPAPTGERLPASMMPEVPHHDATPPLQLVYLVDLYLMTKGERDRAVDGLSAHYATGVPLDERVSLVVYDGTLATVVDRTGDRRELLAGLAEVRDMSARGIQQQISFTPGLSDASIPNERNPEYYERRQRSREFIFELDRRTRRVGNAITATMARYGRADGRRVLVAMTPGHPRTEWSPSYGTIDFINNAAAYPTADLWREVALEAADLGFTLFVVDSSGIAAQGTADVGFGVTDSIDDVLKTATTIQGGPARFNPNNTGQSVDSAANDPNQERGNLGQWLERNRKNLLLGTAEATGGAGLFTLDLAPAIASIRSDLDHYYSLGYAAHHAGDGNEYQITVSIPARPDLTLVHRQAYVDQPAAVRAAQRLRSEMLFGGDANPLGVRVEIGTADGRFRLGAAGSKRVQVPIDVKIPYARLEMVPRGDQYWGQVLITFFNEDATGNQSGLASHVQDITVAADRYQEAVAKGYFRYSSTVELEGGTQKMFVGIQDQLSNRTSIMPQEFQF